MNSDQFARLCQAVEYFQTEYVEVETDDLRALVNAKLEAWERIKYLENEVEKLRGKLEDCTRIIENHDD